MKRDILSRIMDWGSCEDGIQVMVLTGSRAGEEPSDEFSDYDIDLYVSDPRPYADYDDWMYGIGDVLVYVPAVREFAGENCSTRLIIFRDGTKVDISFLSEEALDEVTSRKPLPESYDLGYKVLLDKTAKTDKMELPSLRAYRGGRPTEEEFSNCIREFWFEAYHIPKYLRRGDLWPAKFRDWAAKEQLIRMIEWHEKARHDWDYRTHPLGKRMQEWVSQEIWESLQRCFGSFEARDSWSALFETFRLFGRIARETAEALGLDYPEDVENRICGFAQRLSAADAT